MQRMILVVLILVILFSVPYLSKVLADDVSSCMSHNVCVHPGYYLKYHIREGNTNNSETYTFGNITGTNNILVTKQDYLGNIGMINDTILLDLHTGYGYSEQRNATIPFFAVLPIPIQYNQSDISVVQSTKNFNGFNRTTIIAMHITNSSSLLMEYDIQTGALLSSHSLAFTKLSGKPALIGFSDDLVDTNIISSDSLQHKIVIPAWIKNTAGWWADRTIGDTDFVKAIQYLISNGIMQLSHGSSGHNLSQEIPSWVKTNAGWWARGKISDGDFISGIQYLINSGIVKV